jgi:hypothetical protein
MARVVAFVPDLLFGSNVVGGLSAAGHDPVLVGDPAEIAAALTPGAVLVVDLTAEAPERIAAVGPLLNGSSAPPSLAFFSHVEADVRDAARAAGFDLVVPRSRMARAMGELVDGLAGSAG